MSQFDQIGPGGTPSYVQPTYVDPNQSVLAQVSSGQVPANAILTLGCGAGANVFGGSRPNQTVMRDLSIGHLVANRPLTSQPATPPASGVSNAGSNTITQVVASVTAGVMTVTGIVGLPTLAVGLSILGPTGWPQGLSIASLGTGTGGLGTYNVSAPGAVPANQLSAPAATVVVSIGSGG